MPPRGWTAEDIPDQTGRVFVVTGANSGIGFETARVLVERGGRVVLACRRPEAAGEAAVRIAAAAPGAQVGVEHLDLADLASVEAFAAGVGESLGHIDVLVNNAGVMALPRRTTTDGFEMQFGVNHLGHFALTGRLLPLLRQGRGARVVTLTSTTYRFGHLPFQDLQGERRYRRWGAYAQSKLANMLFSVELARRAEAADVPLLSLAAHPGYADTNLQSGAARARGKEGSRFWSWTNRHFAQSAANGAWPTLRAATDPAAPNGGFYGPRGPLGGPPVPTAVGNRGNDPETARRLWEVSERLTGVRFDL